MKIIRNTMPISDVYQKMTAGELVINRSYQRSKGLWPNNARTYFIDTILNEFPFPKVVLRDSIDLKTKKTKREIIDGQQRLTTIRDFINNKFKLSNVSKSYKGQSYDELDNSIQELLLSYEVSVDLVVSATDEEILEIFRRINSYTLPLNTAEKRHATYQGEFKWFINHLTEEITPFLEQHKVLSLRDFSRMMDADLITECSQLVFEGIQNRSAKKLDNLYKNYDITFDNQSDVHKKIITSFNFLKNNFSELFETYKISSYNFYSLMSALIFNMYGFPSNDDFADIKASQNFSNNAIKAQETLLRMFAEVDEKEENRKYSEFVKASLSTTHSLKHRTIRFKSILDALQS